MNTFLEKIQLTTSASVKIRKEMFPQKKLTFFPSKRVSFYEALKSAVKPVVIAEVKKQSPSLGELNLSVDPAKLAQSYAQNGATAVSVLTESQYFKGSLEDLVHVRMLNSSLPLLQKDFILDEYQIYEARFLGADCILLIVALLGLAETKRLHDLATGLGLSVLVEVHTKEELEIALKIGSKIVGINNRDLHTLKISLDVSRKLIKDIPKDIFVISESGISSGEEISELSGLGFHGFLIGSSLMQHSSPGNKLASLIQGVRA
jgi:indole-3-glycerol phosphate synthase